jgi:hypothetical protein
VKALRRLRTPERGAVERLDDAAVGAALHRVADRQRGDGARRAVERSEDAIDDAGIEKGTRAVMDEDARRRERSEALEAEAHRVLARGAAGDRRQQREPATGRVVMRAVVGMVDDAHAVDRAMTAERLEAVAQQRFAGERQILLGERAAEPGAAARRHHQRNARGHGGGS